MTGFGNGYSESLQAALVQLDLTTRKSFQLLKLIEKGFGNLLQPWSDASLLRWQLLAIVAAHNLSLDKLYEGHSHTGIGKLGRIDRPD